MCIRDRGKGLNDILYLYYYIWGMCTKIICLQSTNKYLSTVEMGSFSRKLFEGIIYISHCLCLQCCCVDTNKKRSLRLSYCLLCTKLFVPLSVLTVFHYLHGSSRLSYIDAEWTLKECLKVASPLFLQLTQDFVYDVASPWTLRCGRQNNVFVITRLSRNVLLLCSIIVLYCIKYIMGNIMVSCYYFKT